MANILEVKNLSYSFHTYGGTVQSVRDVSFEVGQGEIVGIVGESGCGKSVTAQCILKLNPEPPGFFTGGKILYRGEDLVPKKDREMRRYRGSEIGFVFQDPMTSLNPTMRIGRQIEEVFLGQRGVGRAEIHRKCLDILRQVGISDAERRLRQYPNELSGGMKQRVMIAMALIGNPGIIIADEPTTSLDVTIEAQILSLLKSLRDKNNTSIIIITHDLGVIAKMCDRVLVMYGGKILEHGTTDDIFYHTRHPYTKGLLQSIARLDTDKGDMLIPIEGTPPDLFSPPVGCPFSARCDYCMDICNEQMPVEQKLDARHSASECHFANCWLQHESAPQVDLTYHYKGGSENGEE
jgi:oligopeptide/dipeptide ABC transporter, ATP-binding protein, C-terminal domain